VFFFWRENFTFDSLTKTQATSSKQKGCHRYTTQTLHYQTQ